jgi:hypothetical protein
MLKCRALEKREFSAPGKRPLRTRRNAIYLPAFHVFTWLIRQAVVALYPRSEWPGVEDCGLDAFLTRFREETPPLIWLGTVMGALLFHLTPVLTVFVPLPAFLLPRRLLDLHAARITSTNLYLLRQAIFLVKLAAGFCWGTHPSIRARLALPPLPADPQTWRAD